MPKKTRTIVGNESQAENLLNLYNEGWEKDKDVSYNPDGPDHLKIYYLVKYEPEEVLEQSLVNPEKLKDVVMDSVSVPIDKHTDRGGESKETPYQQYVKMGYREGHKTSSAVVMELTEKTTGDYLVDFVLKFSKERGLKETEVMKILVDAVKASSPDQSRVIELPPIVREGYSGQGAETIEATVTDEQAAEEETRSEEPEPEPVKEVTVTFKKASGETVKEITEEIEEEAPKEEKPSQFSDYNEGELGCATCNQNLKCPARAKPIHYRTMIESGLHMCGTHQDYERTKAKKPAKPPAPEYDYDEVVLGCGMCAKDCAEGEKQEHWNAMKKENSFGCKKWELREA